MTLPIRVSAAITVAFLALGTLASAQNQYVILYPGSGNPSTILQVYQPQGALLNLKSSINTLPAGTFQILPMPDGSKYYLISSNGWPVSKMDATFSAPVPIASAAITVNPLNPSSGLVQKATAALTPDGSRLVVSAGNNVYVIDTATDNAISQTGIPLNGPARDLVISNDSTRAFVLTQGTAGPAGTVVTAIDLTAAVPVVAGTLKVNGDAVSPATGLAFSPNGLLYLSGVYRIYEIDPATMTVTLPKGEIPVEGYPEKPFITSDGKYLVSPNKTNLSGSLFIQVDLTSKNASRFPPSGASQIADTIVQLSNQGPDANGNDRVYAFSGSQKVYDLTLGANSTTCPGCPYAANSKFAGAIPGSVNLTALQFSAENPPLSAWGTYISDNGNNTLTQFDITAGSQSPVKVVVPNSTLGTLATPPTGGGNLLVRFNNNQIVNPGARVAMPIVAQLVDQLGRPIYQGRVFFTSSTAGVVISTNATNTNPACTTAVTANCPFITGSNGYAVAYITAPNIPGTTFTVTATVGTNVSPVDFTFTTTGTSTGGTGGGTSGSLAGLFYVAGNGQIVYEGVRQNVPMQVVERDATGKPLPNATVTWTTDFSSGSFTSTTDNNGVASLVLPGINGVTGTNTPSFATKITATDPNGSFVTFVYTTIPNLLPDGTRNPYPTVVEYIIDANGNVINQFPNGRSLVAAAGSVIKKFYFFRIVNTAGPWINTGIPNIGMCFTNSNPTGNPIPDASGNYPLSTCGLLPTAAGQPFADCSPQPVSDSSGFASCDLKVGTVLGSTTITPVIGGFGVLASINLTVTPGPPTVLTILGGDKQTGKPSTSLPYQLQLQVADVSGNLLSGVPITWTAILNGTGVKLSSTSTVTNSNGVTSVNVVLPPTPGPVKIQASVNKDVFIQFNLNVDAQVGGVTYVSGDIQKTFSGQPFTDPLVVIVRDQQGNALPNTSVNFSVGGPATIVGSTSSVTTGTDGKASIKLTATNSTGSVTVTASVGNFQASFTNLTVLQPGPQISTASFVSEASAQLYGLTPCGLGVVQGSQIAPGVQGRITSSGFGPNPTTLGPVQSLTISGIAAPLTFVENINGVERVGFQTPCEVPVGSASIVMNVNGGTSTVTGVPVSAYLPGLYEAPASDGQFYAQAIHVKLPDGTLADGSFVGPTNPAVPGETIRILATGLGQTTPAIRTNVPGIGGQTVIATLGIGFNDAGGGKPDAQYQANQIGKYYIEFVVPPNSGSRLKISLGAQPPNGGGASLYGNDVYIPVQQ